MNKYLFFFIIALTTQSYFSQSWNSLASGMNDWTTCMVEDTVKNVLYAGGQFTQASGVNTSHLAKWNGSTWTSLGAGADAPLHSLAIINGDLYVGGDFFNISGIQAKRIAKFDGTNWTALGTGILGSVNAITEYNGEIYAGSLAGLHKWTGSIWQPIIEGDETSEPYILDLEVYNGELYFTGYFTINGNSSNLNIAKWNGSQLVDLNVDLDNGSASTLEVYNNELYVGGVFSSVNGNTANCIVKYNGSNWQSIAGATGGVFGFETSVNALKKFNNKLYVGGNFNAFGSVAANFIVEFDGANYNSLSSGTNERVICLASYNNNLVVGGRFPQAGGLTMNNIAEWTTQLGIFEQNLDKEVLIYPNPNKGDFEIKLDESITGIVRCEIVDLTGKIVDDSEMFISNGKIECNEKLDSGMYLIRITDSAKDQDYIGRISVE